MEYALKYQENLKGLIKFLRDVDEAPVR